jgi:hypothetical protein
MESTALEGDTAILARKVTPVNGKWRASYYRASFATHRDACGWNHQRPALVGVSGIDNVLAQRR